MLSRLRGSPERSLFIGDLNPLKKKSGGVVTA